MRKVVLAVCVALCTVSMSGCMGQMGLTKEVTGLNLKAVDNRYGRAGLYILLSPVYAFTSSVDLLIINSIEFWTETNPITKKTPAVVDTPVEAWIKANEALPEETTKAPVSSK